MKILLILPLSIIVLFGLVQDTHAQESSPPLIEQKTMSELNSIIVTLLEEKRYEESLFYLDKILETHPNHKNALLNKGSVLVSLDRSEEAIPYYDRLLVIEPENIKGLTNKAVALVNTGEKLNALKLFNKVLSLDRDNEQIQTAKAKLLSMIPTQSTHRSYNTDTKYDVHVRVTARTSSGELISVVETAYGRYLPVDFTDYVFNNLFEKEIVEINNQKYEMATKSDSYTTDNEYIGNFYFEVIMNGHSITVFEAFPPHVGIEPNDQLYAEWTILKKVI
jgi:tetratricopeptide (TPR) repeat protein|tara:strand:+ start:1095 stop:1928 length:834 start_codon:yes stop_codon:yes gene_type:complete